MGLTEAVVTLGLALIAAVVYCVRLEGEIRSHRSKLQDQDNEITLLRTKYEGVESRILNEMSRMRESLARLEGHLGFGSHPNKA